MEMVTLDANLQPDQLVERYASLLWTERYFNSGDFQLTTTDVERMLKLLPLESFVSLRESSVPMMVEVHKIEKKSREAPVLTVVGRSVETVLERRAASNTPTLPAFTRQAWMITAAKESDAAYLAMRSVLGDTAQPTVGMLATPPALSPLDAIPEIRLIPPADYASTGQTISYEIKPGNLYSSTLELMTTNHHGLKAVRPLLGDNKIGIEIYNGADLTNDVIFDAKFDQFGSATYLLSEQGSNNVAYVYGSNGSQLVLKTAAPEPSGLARRVLMMDLVSDTTSGSVDVRRTRGLNELFKYNATALFDGQIAEQVAAGYNHDYFLGDIIRLDGEYGLSEFVRVAEFIRSDDNTGSKAYPTFEVVAE